MEVIVVTPVTHDTLAYLERVKHYFRKISLVVTKHKVLDIELPYKTISKYDKVVMQESLAYFADTNVAILDIGGTMIPYLHLFEKKINIVEDTRNGYLKYSKLKPQKNLKWDSVHDSEYKVVEDYLVGQSIVESASVWLRQQGLNLRTMSLGVIGFGRIGQSVAEHLSHISSNIIVRDLNHAREILAQAKGFKTHMSSKVEQRVLEQVSFCCTGSKLRYLFGDSYVFPCTSIDDEFLRVPSNVPFSGVPINFMHGTNATKFMWALQHEMITKLLKLCTTI